jgi:hypothetical protein
MIHKRGCCLVPTRHQVATAEHLRALPNSRISLSAPLTTDLQATMSSSKAYSGSCHCGFVQYQIRLTFPPVLERQANDSTTKSISLYKCNCSTCQKMGFFHCRPIDPQKDFILISPTSFEELGDYRTFSKTQGWHFCKNCGVRVFGVAGKWEQADIDIGKWAGAKHTEEVDELQPVLRTKATTRTRMVDGKETTKDYHYISVNAVTLEPSDEIDLRMWHEKGWIVYVDCRSRTESVRLGKPFEGGMY